MTPGVVLCARCGAEQRTDPRVLCEPCGTELHGHLRSVREVLVMLRDTAARLDRIDRRGGNDDDVRRTLDARFPLTAAATSSPVSFVATNAAEDVRRVVTRWARRMVAEQLPTLPGCTDSTCRHPWSRPPVCADEQAAADRRAARLRAVSVSTQRRWEPPMPTSDRMASAKPWYTSSIPIDRDKSAPSMKPNRLRSF
jgi:hypothetical protein